MCVSLFLFSLSFPFGSSSRKALLSWLQTAPQEPKSSRGMEGSDASCLDPPYLLSGRGKGHM